MLDNNRNTANQLTSALILVLMLAYPFVIYHFINDISPRWFGFVLFCVFVVRFVAAVLMKQSKDITIYAVGAFFCINIVVFNSEQLLKLYPVLMNAGVGLLFFISLFWQKSLIEKFAHAGKHKPPESARGYLRKLNIMWGTLLLCNSLVSLYTAWFTSLSIWTLYNGILSYVIIASFAIGEWLFRIHYKKKHGIVDDRN